MDPSKVTRRALEAFLMTHPELVKGKGLQSPADALRNHGKDGLAIATAAPQAPASKRR